MSKLYYDSDGKAKKYCPRCNTTYEEPEKVFAVDNNRPDKLQKYCKECSNKNTRKFRKEHAETYTEYEKQRNKDRRQYRQDRYYNRTPEQIKSTRSYANQWHKDNPTKSIAYGQKRRAVKSQSIIDPLDYKIIVQRDGYVCHICHNPIDQKLKGKNLGALTYDHVIPLNPRAGEPQGTHTYDNIKPAHFSCNARKGNRPMSTLSKHDRRGL